MTNFISHAVFLAIQAIHDDHNVCEDWGKDHYFALALPKADFDCATLNPVHDNSETYAARADVVGACEACLASDCLKAKPGKRK